INKQILFHNRRHTSLNSCRRQSCGATRISLEVRIARHLGGYGGPPLQLLRYIGSQRLVAPSDSVVHRHTKQETIKWQFIGLMSSVVTNIDSVLTEDRI